MNRQFCSLLRFSFAEISFCLIVVFSTFLVLLFCRSTFVEKRTFKKAVVKLIGSNQLNAAANADGKSLLTDALGLLECPTPA